MEEDPEWVERFNPGSDPGAPCAYVHYGIRYFPWADQVVAGCRGVNAALDRRYDEVRNEGLAAIDEEPPSR